jgi:4-diphosphocytidyl-2-C-methyl-D-erythritol kinase
MTTAEARVEAQAKLNLFLRVLEREDTGYHQIETLFCRIALADSVSIRVGGTARHLDMTGPRLPATGIGPTEKNLAWRAAEAYAAATGFPGGFEIAIDKRIPVGGGLGGGSADAGAVLRLLNALNPSPIAPVDLLPIASSLGADVPFLTVEAPMAVGRGYGEALEIVPPLIPRPVWLVIPDVGVNTADAYRWLDESRAESPVPTLSASGVRSWETLADLASNDFEAVVGKRVPVVGRLLAGFRSDAFAEVLGESAIVLMSGSGSTIAVVAGGMARNHWQAMPPIPGIEVVETETVAFVEPVVRTH